MLYDRINIDRKEKHFCESCHKRIRTTNDREWELFSETGRCTNCYRRGVPLTQDIHVEEEKNPVLKFVHLVEEKMREIQIYLNQIKRRNL
jgi:hydrogenase maturation factor HypF (carbamoyltransferase family)